MRERYPTQKVLNQWDIDLKKNLRSQVAMWWARIPITKGERRCFPLRMAPEHERLLGEPEIHVCNSELVRRGRDLYLHLKIRKPVLRDSQVRRRVLAVDIGEKNLATSVMWDGSSLSEPMFHARTVRGLRRHYGWLRKVLQEKRHYRALARIRATESRKVMEILHEASRYIVNKASQEDAAIALGDLRGLRSRFAAGRRARVKRLARIVHSMPYGKLMSFIQYKASWQGVPVLLINEAYTSKRCHRCNNEGSRPSQSLFICSFCGWTGNADINGAANIGKRAWGYMLHAGAPESEPDGGQPEFNRDRPI